MKKEIKANDVCYIKLRPESPDYWCNNFFVTVTEKVLDSEGGPAWKFKPDLYSPRHGVNFAYIFERNLVPLPGPTVEDVKDTIEVLGMQKNNNMSALLELKKIAIKIDERTAEEVE